MATREGSLEAPTRHVIDWRNPDFTDATGIESEMRRVFDICHGCRRCFNLCDAFPRLFDLIDDSATGELDSVDGADFRSVTDACTFCDMCFMTKCPYVPPHEFDLDFPHLMLRARAAEFRRGERSFVDRRIADTDGNGRLGTTFSPLANWAVRRGNRLTRPLMDSLCGIHARAELPAFNVRSLVSAARAEPLEVNAEAPAFGRRAVIYATCFSNWNDAAIGEAFRRVLAHNGVETTVVHPACCGMPRLEQGDLGDVARRAGRISAELCGWIDRGFDVVSLVPSCSLMMKFEWPLIVPDDDNVARLAAHARDASEYIVAIARGEGLAGTLEPVEGPVTLHVACHARAQNMGAKAAEMLRLIPETAVNVVERCSGHGGSWGVRTATFETGMKVGRTVMRSAARHDPEGRGIVASECPLAALHIRQGVGEMEGREAPAPAACHPVEVMAGAWGLSRRDRP